MACEGKARARVGLVGLRKLIENRVRRGKLNSTLNLDQASSWFPRLHPRPYICNCSLILREGPGWPKRARCASKIASRARYVDVRRSESEDPLHHRLHCALVGALNLDEATR
jgi:hypothetical protein